MSRLPGYFRDLYLDARNDPHRLSGTPVDLAHLVDAMGEPAESLQLDGLVLRCKNPKPFADAVGHVCVSIVPAVLDELLRRDDADRDSYFLDPFSIFVVGAGREEIAVLLAPFPDLVRAAVVDHFEEIGEECDLTAEGLTLALETEVAELVAECALALELVATSLRFEPGDRPRGERLLDHLFDGRSSVFELEPWPPLVVL